jgi:phospholipase/lecithinase/hemolysin
MKSLCLAASLTVLSAVAAPAATLSDVFSSFYVLGDSLSDDGNLGPFAPPPPYFNGQFSNGPVYADLLDDQFTSPGSTQNYAYGGAEAVPSDDGLSPPDLPTQLALFLTDPSLVKGARPLVGLWFGANDIFNAITSGGDAETAGTNAANAVLGAIQTIAASTIVRDFVVLNLPNLGQTPAFFGSSDATDATTAFNDTLAAGLAPLERALNIYDIDVFSLFADIVNGALDIGVNQVALPCVIGTSYCGPVEAQNRLFFDGVHPNSVAHAELARIIETEVSAVPVPGGLPLLAGAFVLGGFVFRRRRAAL